MTNDRAVGKPAFPSQIAGKILVNPIALLRTSLSGTIGQVSCGSAFIDIANAKLPAFQPTAEIANQTQTPPCG
jgi:hypothetical protein